MPSDYCCTGMLKGRESGAIVAYQEAAVLAIRLAPDVTPLGIQPYLILQYCPSCGRRLDPSAPPVESVAARGEIVPFPERGERPPGPPLQRI